MSDAVSAWAPNTYPKQNDIRWAVHPDNPSRTRDLCVSGPRFSSKTIGCLHAQVEHAWEVDQARFGIISPTVTSATDGGCWQKLTEEIIPEWIAGDFGMKWHREPYQESVSKRIKCSIINKHGSVSSFQLESFREGATERDIATRFKNKEFSGLYVSEAATWIHTRAAYDILIKCFRGKWKANEFTFIWDTNPEPPGEEHWMYQLWWKFRKASEEQLLDLIGDKSIKLEDMKAVQKRLGLIEVFVSDNLGLTEEKLSELKTAYAHNPELWGRYFEGKWTSASGDGLFSDVFRPNIHVIGEAESPINPNPQMLVPAENCTELFGGWDLGSTNHAAVVLEKFLWPDAKGNKVAHFNILDEQVYLHSDVNIGEFTENFMEEKMDFWEEYLGRQILWMNFSDRSSFDYRDSMSERRQHIEVATVSHGRIKLIGVAKYPGSVQMRVDLVRRLLFSERLNVSKTRCPHLVAALQSLRKGKNSPVDKQSEHKHVFDALTYALQHLCMEELFRASKANLAKPSMPTHIAVQL